MIRSLQQRFWKNADIERADPKPVVANVRLRARAQQFLPLIIAAFVLGTFYMVSVHDANPAITGDEPHYLLLARAISHGTLDVQGVYRGTLAPAWLRGFPTDQTQEVNGHLRSMRTPLLPLVLAPAMRVGSLTLVRLTMILFGLAFFDQLWRLLTELEYRGAARAGPWLVALTALPVLGYATRIYPEMPGALGVVIILRLFLRRSRRALLEASLVAGLLPWLIIRFALLGAGFAFIAVLLAARGSERDARLVALPFVGLMALMAVYAKALYGTFDIRAIYPPTASKPWTPWHVYEVGLGSLIGRGQGLLPYAPAFILGLIGLGVAARRSRAIGSLILGIAAAHLLYVVPQGFWGFALPARFAIVLVPLLVIGVAEMLRVLPAARIALLVLIVLQLAIVVAYHDLRLLTDVPRYNYLAIFPPVDEEPGIGSAIVRPADGVGAVARVVGQSVQTTTANGPGRVFTSPAWAFRPGQYTVEFSFHATARTNEVIARVRALQLPSNKELGARDVRVQDLTRPIAFQFRAPAEPLQWTNRVQLQVESSGRADFELRLISAQPTQPLRSRAGVEHDGVPLGLAWIGAIAIVAVWLARKRGVSPPRDRELSAQPTDDAVSTSPGLQSVAPVP